MVRYSDWFALLSTIIDQEQDLHKGFQHGCDGFAEDWENVVTEEDLAFFVTQQFSLECLDRANRLLRHHGIPEHSYGYSMGYAIGWLAVFAEYQNTPGKCKENIAQFMELSGEQ